MKALCVSLYLPNQGFVPIQGCRHVQVGLFNRLVELVFHRFEFIFTILQPDVRKL